LRGFMLLVLVLLASACTQSSEKPVRYLSIEDEMNMPGGAQDIAPEIQELSIAEILAQGQALEGTLVSTSGVAEQVVQAGGYTYVKLGDGNASIWVAGPRAAVKEGMRLNLSGALVMLDFSAGALNRTLEVMLMSDSLIEELPFNTSVPKLEDGYTVAEVLQKAGDLEGRVVRVRGVVTKVLPGIMNLTWVHLQDGTSAPEGSELIFTSSSAGVVEGEVVIAEGVVERNVDIGYHTVFRVLVTNATFVQENLNTSAE